MFEIKVTPKILDLMDPLERSKYSLDDSIKVSLLVNLISTKSNNVTDDTDFTNGDVQSLLFSKKNPLKFVYPEPFVAGSSYSAEFKAQLGKLRMKQEEISYDAMVNKQSLPLSESQKNGFTDISNYSQLTSTTLDQDNMTPQEINKQVKEQITTIFNILLSVISVIWAVWYWSGKYVSVGYKIIFCLAFGILVLVAEVVVYNSYLRKLNEAKMTERSKKMTKKIIKKYSVDKKLE